MRPLALYFVGHISLNKVEDIGRENPYTIPYANLKIKIVVYSSAIKNKSERIP
jgi:hypothetical protein